MEIHAESRRLLSGRCGCHRKSHLHLPPQPLGPRDVIGQLTASKLRVPPPARPAGPRLLTQYALGKNLQTKKDYDELYTHFRVVTLLVQTLHGEQRT
ncbi:Hypothetical protein SMAX5B_015441 [Scophthalmus maximus]|uniref:Uncharacterized protein n=1 Tax=Scophthalmus maximus TaxID=52904 RepID=A0A2U9BZU7_SCOMX|nr:Hypothetical protein SMAX5B_015441 [Scophthalmus maximus]